MLLARLGGADVKGVASAFAAATTFAYMAVAFDYPQQVLRTARDNQDLSRVPGMIIAVWPYYLLLASLGALVSWTFGYAGPAWLFAGTFGYLVSTHAGVAANGLAGPVSTAVGAVCQQAGLVVLTALCHLTVGLDENSARLIILGSYLTPIPYFLLKMQSASGRKSGRMGLLRGEFLGMLKVGLRWQPVRLTQLLLLRADTLAAYWFLGAAATGVYSVGLSTAMLIGIVPAQFAARTMFRATTGRGPTPLRDLRAALLSGAAASVLLGLIGWWVIPIVYGPAFTDAYLVQLAVTPGVVAYGGIQVLTNHLRLAGNPITIGTASAIGFGAMVVTTALAVAPWGLLGIAAGSSIGSISALGAAYILVQRRQTLRDA